MESTFVAKICAGCVHYVAVGNGAKGGLRSEKCFHARDTQEKEKRQFMAGFKHGVDLSTLEACPSPKVKEKLALIQGSVKS